MAEEEAKAIQAEFEACGIKVFLIDWWSLELEFPSGARLSIGGDDPPHHGIEYAFDTLEQRRELVRSYGTDPDF